MRCHTDSPFKVCCQRMQGVPVLGDGRRPPDAIQDPKTARAPSKRRFDGAQRRQERRVDAARVAPCRGDDDASTARESRRDRPLPEPCLTWKQGPQALSAPRSCRGEARCLALAWEASGGDHDCRRCAVTSTSRLAISRNYATFQNRGQLRSAVRGLPSGGR